MHKTVKQVRITTDTHGADLTISRVPESGFYGKTTYRIGVSQAGTDHEFARLDETDLNNLNEALLELLESNDGD